MRGNMERVRAWIGLLDTLEAIVQDQRTVAETMALLLHGAGTACVTCLTAAIKLVESGTGYLLHCEQSFMPHGSGNAFIWRISQNLVTEDAGPIKALASLRATI